MEMTEEMMQYVHRTNNLHQEIISSLEKQEEYILWLVLGSIQVHVVYKEKALLPKFLEFDNLLNTLYMCFIRDPHDLLEDASEIDCFDLMDWSQRIEDIFKEMGRQELVFIVELDRYIGNTHHRGRLWDKWNHRQMMTIVDKSMPMLHDDVTH